MINTDQELEVTKQRIAKFQEWLVKFRQTARPTEFDALASGYRLEIEKMQAEVLDYLLRPLPNQPEVQAIIQ